MVILATILAALFSACSTERPPFYGTEYRDGPVRLFLGNDEAEVRMQCHGRPGCAGLGPEGEYIIVCPKGDMQCIVHELRHHLQPNWKHS